MWVRYSVVTMTQYRPGVCNIGREERRKRRTAGALSFAVAAAYALFVIGTGRPAGLLFGSFPFLFGGFVGAVQHRTGFCAAFGALARYDLSGSGGGTGKVGDADAVKRDRVRALQVLAVAMAAAVVTTMVVYGIGVVVV